MEGNTRIKTQQEKFSALLYLTKINEMDPLKAMRRMNFEDMTPIFPNERLKLECGKTSHAYYGFDVADRKRPERYDRLASKGR